MPDQRTRELDRRALAGDPEAAVAALRARLRAGLVVPGYTSAREVACPAGCTPEAGWPHALGSDRHPCPRCNGTGSLPCDPMDLVRLRAYSGDAAARVVLGGWEHWTPVPLRWDHWPVLLSHGCVEGGYVVPNAVPGVDTWSLLDWLTGLKRLAAKLPPARVEVECETPGCPSWSLPAPGRCGCNGTGKVTHDTPADRYLLVVAAHAVAWAVVEETGQKGYVVWDALSAVAAWIADPTPENERAVRRLVDQGKLGRPDWCWQVLRAIYAWDGAGRQAPGAAIQAAAKILGDDRTRELAASAVLEVLGD